MNIGYEEREDRPIDLGLDEPARRLHTSSSLMPRVKKQPTAFITEGNEARNPDAGISADIEGSQDVTPTADNML